MSVTLKQIADAVGVSQPLVTYALNGKPGVSDAMRRRILEEAERLGYDRGANRIAQQMAAKRHGRRVETGIIAVVCRFQDEGVLPNAPAYRTLLDGIEHEAAGRGLDLFITPAREGVMPRLVRERGVDGIILATPAAICAGYSDLQMPKITLGVWNPSTYSLVPDDEGGAYAAVKYLVEVGHNRIAFVGAKHDLQAEARRAGYMRALKDSGIPVEESLMQEVPSADEEHGGLAVTALLRKNRTVSPLVPAFSALVCQNDLLAMGALRAAERHDFRVPEDVSVIGFDDAASSKGFKPPLTSVGYCSRDMAQRALEWLCGEIRTYLDNPAGSAAWQPSLGVEKFPTHLTVRNSSRHWPPDPSCGL